jgi:hypothetical protein
LGKKSRGGFQLKRLGEIDLGDRGGRVADFAAARAYPYFDHHHVAGTTDALGFDRLAGFEEDGLGLGRWGDYEHEQEQGRKRGSG